MLSSDLFAPAPYGRGDWAGAFETPGESPRSPRRRLTADRAGTWGFTGLGEQSRTPKGTRTWGKGSFLSRKRSTAHVKVGVGPSGPTDAVPSRDRNVGFTSLPSGGQLSALPAFPRGRRRGVSTVYGRGDCYVQRTRTRKLRPALSAGLLLSLASSSFSRPGRLQILG